MSYKAIFFLRDTFTYFNYFSIRDSLWVERLFLSDKKKTKECLVIYLYTRISGKSQVNFLTANARFIRNIGTRFSVFSWMDFSSIHITTCSITTCAKFLFSMNTFHCNKLFMSPNRIKSDLYINGGLSLTLLNEKKKLFIVNLFLNINQFSFRTKVFYIYFFF